MFEKIVVVDSTGLNTWGVERLKELGKEVVFYTGIPETDEEIVNRIGDADCVLVSYNTQIRRNVIEACPNIKYIGMCCTLYSESSANVDIAAARERGITVLGIRDYGDEGVVEYVISELVRLLHGFDGVFDGISERPFQGIVQVRQCLDTRYKFDAKSSRVSIHLADLILAVAAAVSTEIRFIRYGVSLFGVEHQGVHSQFRHDTNKRFYLFYGKYCISGAVQHHPVF